MTLFEKRLICENTCFECMITCIVGCFSSKLGAEYVGTIAQTADGIPCQVNLKQSLLFTCACVYDL